MNKLFRALNCLIVASIIILSFTGCENKNKGQEEILKYQIDEVQQENNQESNIFEWEKAKIGDKVGTMTIKSLEESYYIADFEGEITLSGMYKYINFEDAEGKHKAVIFTPDEKSKRKVPNAKICNQIGGYDRNYFIFAIGNTDEFKHSFGYIGNEGEAKLTFDYLRISYGGILLYSPAKLTKVININCTKNSEEEAIRKNLEGKWVGANDNEYSGTDVRINFQNENEFDIKIQAFHMNVNNSPHMGAIIGKGLIKDGTIVFDADEGELKGEITLKDNHLNIKYIGDVTSYAGLNVRFATDLVRKK